MLILANAVLGETGRDCTRVSEACAQLTRAGAYSSPAQSFVASTFEGVPPKVGGSFERGALDEEAERQTGKTSSSAMTYLKAADRGARRLPVQARSTSPVHA